jgi:hypothetical protein
MYPCIFSGIEKLFPHDKFPGFNFVYTIITSVSLQGQGREKR